MSDAVVLYAPAKLTWNLSVGTRADSGLHRIEAEMMSIDLFDEIVLTPGRSGVTVTADGVAATMVPADASNLVVRALSLAGRQASVAITKRIPVGGGLGGGSSDAAAVLRWARIYDHATALSLGSDVAFCVSGGRAMVSGYGEQVEPLAYLERSVVLCLVPLEIHTAEVYRAFDELESSGDLHRGRNDLTQAAYVVEPRLGRIAAELGELSGSDVVLAGSGSTMFLEGTKQLLGIGGIDTLRMDGLECRFVECVSVKPEVFE